MSEPGAPSSPTQQGSIAASRLLELVARPGPLRRSGGGLIAAWHAESGTDMPFDEWCDPAARHLASVFETDPRLDRIEDAVVSFAQARAGADHTAAEVAADIVALVRLTPPGAGPERNGWIDPLGLLARTLGAWATERVTVASSVDCVDPATGLVTARFLERRLHELHAQCDALAIPPPMTFGSVVVQLGLSAVAAAERMGVRIAAGRILADRFRAGETVAALSYSRSACRMAAVMPAYGLDRAMAAVRADLAPLVERHGGEAAVARAPFRGDAASTFATLAGTDRAPYGTGA